MVCKKIEGWVDLVVELRLLVLFAESLSQYLVFWMLEVY